MQVVIHRIPMDGSIRMQLSRRMAIITLNRAKKHNALTRELWQQLYEMVVHLSRSGQADVLVIRGQGEAFTAGSDIYEFSQLSLQEVDEAFETMEKAVSAVESLPIPTIGVINGFAMGAGFELALACDLRIGCEKTKMGIPVGRLGITLSQKFAKRIVDLLGPSRAKDLVFTGRIYSGEEAFRLGLLNYYVKSDELNSAVVELADKVQSQSQASLRAIKESVAKCVQTTVPAWNERGFPYFVDSRDFPEGVRAFLEKRSPRFKRWKRR
jgi:enoyl-CoA hydratase